MDQKLQKEVDAEIEIKRLVIKNQEDILFIRKVMSENNYKKPSDAIRLIIGEERRNEGVEKMFTMILQMLFKIEVYAHAGASLENSMFDILRKSFIGYIGPQMKLTKDCIEAFAPSFESTEHNPDLKIYNTRYIEKLFQTYANMIGKIESKNCEELGINDEFINHFSGVNVDYNINKNYPHILGTSVNPFFGVRAPEFEPKKDGENKDENQR